MTGNVPQNSVPNAPSGTRIPKTLIAINREEFIDPVELTIRNAAGEPTKLPDDLHGHYFLVSPAGLHNSFQLAGPGKTVWVTQDGWTPIYNGDGLIFRFSFNQGKAQLKTRLVKPPCYFADLATSDANSSFRDLAFISMGLSRTSLNKLGLRNQLNTNFIPFKLPDQKHDRLVVTWDVGRPYEIDPETLETLYPVGKNQDWAELVAILPPQPFKTLMSSAHPVYDPNTGEFFTLNVGKSLITISGLARSFRERLVDNSKTIKFIKEKFWITRILIKLIKAYNRLIQKIGNLFNRLGIGQKVRRLLRYFFRSYDFVHLLAWDGKKIDISSTWEVVLPDGSPIRIDQTTHQMGITKDYIIFAESSFKFSLDNTLPYHQDSLVNSIKILISDVVNYPQYPSTKLYIIKRADLKTAERPQANIVSKLLNRNSVHNVPQVKAQAVELAPEFSHFVADFENPNNQITLYISHLAASDIAEYIHIFDRSTYDDRDKDYNYQDPDLSARVQELAGNITGPMDINRLGRWVIDGETGEVLEQQQFPDESDREAINQQIDNNNLDVKYQFPWSTAFFVNQDQRPTNKITDIFWNSWGCWPDTITHRIVEANQRYPHRLIDMENLRKLAYQGIPSSICHTKIRSDDNNQTTFKICDQNYYQFPPNHLGSSAHYIPRPQAKNQTDGYIISVVLTSDHLVSQSDQPDNDPHWSRNNEVWVFDAAKLNEGPICKMSHPQLNVGFAFHTTWLPEVESPEKKLDYSVREDHDYIIEQIIEQNPELGKQIQSLFNQEIYPKFEE